jgi:hypothetical protein|tara:strand:- start:8098 stop:8415 length:318 start_codon:yes stop_codon:yes gene_type:complete
MAHAYKNKKVDFNSTNAVDILAPATNTTAIIKSMLLSDDGGGSNFLMKIVNGADTFNIFNGGTIASNGTTELLTHPLVLQHGDTLKITAATADRLHLVMSYLEVS